MKDKLLKKILKVQGFQNIPFPNRTDGFSDLKFNGTSIAHFHSDNEIDIRLTPKIIRENGLSRAHDQISHPARSKNSRWISVRFESDSDLMEVERLLLIAKELK